VSPKPPSRSFHVTALVLLVVFGGFFLAWGCWGIHPRPGSDWFYVGVGVVNWVAAVWYANMIRRRVPSDEPSSSD
jgi:hypothetical protein